MTIETLGEAYDNGWCITARCAFGKHQAMKARECHESWRLDLRTMLWTRGRAFPLAMLPSRLRCPACGSRYVRVLFDVPAPPKETRFAR